ncbi:uncharacterized protein (DUF342 family) [Alkalibacillus flavidus]|uniref:Uncharacterized protein (DUF342 family) n=1 Tax=Alkalibacillus flavidus TaxID=546021 RepID=A0ABV2KRF3_9BACI
MELTDFIKLKVSDDRLTASLEADMDYIESVKTEQQYNEEADDENDGENDADEQTEQEHDHGDTIVETERECFDEIVTVDAVLTYVEEQGVQVQVDREAVESFCEFVLNTESFEEKKYSQAIAHGQAAVDGDDGYLDYHINLMTENTVDDSDQKVDFKEMMKIPIVEIDDPLVTFVSPTEGENGTDVYGQDIKPKRGKDVSLKTGENTKLNDNNATVYATDSGQVTFTEKEIKVLPVYEVQDNLDLKVGNIDFNGSIVINGDVPEGFTLKARGDIAIQGVVEASYLEACGSVFIKEGVSALGKGHIKATLDIFAGNVNQANLEAGRHVQVNNSILHSDVIAREQVICQKGHIIGGSVSGGQYVEAKDIGNRMSSKTKIFLGENKKAVEKKTYIETRMKELIDQLKKLKAIGDKLEQVKQTRDLSSKERVTLLRQKHSYEKVRLELNELNDKYKIYAKDENSEEEVEQLIKVVVHGRIYPNVEVNVGKYAKVFDKESDRVSVIFQDRDFSVNPLV